MAQRSAISSSGSIAPVPTVPALAATQNGRWPGGAVGGDRGAQRGDVHPAALVGGDLVDRVNPEAEDLGRLLDTAVALRGDVEPERRAAACCRPSVAHVPAVLERGAVTGRGERDQGRRRSAAHQKPHAVLGRKPDQLHEPADGGPLDVDRRVVAARAARVHRGGEKVGDDADRCRRRVHPAEEPRMAVAHRVGQDGRAKALEHGVRSDAGGFERLLASGSSARSESSAGRRAPRRPRRDSRRARSTAACARRRNCAGSRASGRACRDARSSPSSPAALFPAARVFRSAMAAETPSPGSRRTSSRPPLANACRQSPA